MGWFISWTFGAYLLGTIGVVIWSTNHRRWIEARQTRRKAGDHHLPRWWPKQWLWKMLLGSGLWSISVGFIAPYAFNSCPPHTLNHHVFGLLYVWTIFGSFFTGWLIDMTFVDHADTTPIS